MEKLNVENKVYCKYLRTKNPYGSLEGGGNHFFIDDNANTICWCVVTQGGMGPDSGLVDPPICVEGRKCYLAPDK